MKKIQNTNYSGRPQGTASNIYQFLLVAIILCSLLFSGCRNHPNSTLDGAFYKQYGKYTYCTMMVTKQRESYSCGTACLSSVLTYWEHYTSEYELIRQYPSVGSGGYSLMDLKRMAQERNIHAFILTMKNEPRVRLTEQIEKGRPTICAVRYPRGFTPNGYLLLGWILVPRSDHFVVAFGMRNDRILLMDPATGFVDLSWDQFEKFWREKEYAALVCGK